MYLDETNGVPLFQQISEGLENAILTWAYKEGDQIPSTTELSVGYRINPATALKGVNLLVDEGILYKKRGLGVFVAEGGVDRIRQKRLAEFREHFVHPLQKEAKRLGISTEEVIAWLHNDYE